MKPTLEQRLENWAECFRLHLLRGQAHSFEGTSRSSRFSEEQGAPVNRAESDVLDAQIIEDATQLMPLYEHLLLRFHYVRRWSANKCLREAADGARVPRSEYEGFPAALNMAHALLRAALLIPSVVRKVRVREIVRAALAFQGESLAQSGPQPDDGRSRYSAQWEGGVPAVET